MGRDLLGRPDDVHLRPGILRAPQMVYALAILLELSRTALPPESILHGLRELGLIGRAGSLEPLLACTFRAAFGAAKEVPGLSLLEGVFLAGFVRLAADSGLGMVACPLESALHARKLE